MIKVKGSGRGGVDLSLANASPEHVLEGMKFFSNGSKEVQVGTLSAGSIFSYVFTGTNTDTTSGSTRTIMLTSSGTFTPHADLTVTVTVQGGGGGGGDTINMSGAYGGNGGIGYAATQTVSLTKGTNYGVTVGAGGNAGNRGQQTIEGSYVNSVAATAGGNTSAFGVSAAGGQPGTNAIDDYQGWQLKNGIDGAGATSGFLVDNKGLGGRTNSSGADVKVTAGAAGCVQIQFNV